MCKLALAAFGLAWIFLHGISRLLLMSCGAESVVMMTKPTD